MLINGAFEKCFLKINELEIIICFYTSTTKYREMLGSTTIILEFTEICQIKDKKKDSYIRHFIFVNLDTFIMTLPEIGSHLASSSLSKVVIPDIYLNIQYVLKKIKT